MDVRWISSSRVEDRTWSDVPPLLQQDDGFVWIRLAAALEVKLLVGFETEVGDRELVAA